MPPDEIGSRIGAVLPSDVVRRVERDEGAQEFGQKNRDERKSKKHLPSAHADEETPQDVIEVSGQYHPAGASSLPAPAPPVAHTAATRAPRSKGAFVAPPSPERHIDLKV